jgi:hypothetical protein
MQRLVKVDGKTRIDKCYPAGFMGEWVAKLFFFGMENIIHGGRRGRRCCGPSEGHTGLASLALPSHRQSQGCGAGCRRRGG